MALIDCSRCGEKVDDAKAFCPACGDSLLDERPRTLSTNFEQMDMTVQLGNTVFNKMLTDMGLNTSRAPDAGHDLPAEPPVFEPAVTEPPSISSAPPVAATPSAAVSAPRPEAPVPSVPTKASNRKIWIVTIVVGLALLFLALLVVGAAGVIFYLSGAR